MPARLGEIPLAHLAVTRLDDADKKFLDNFAKDYGVKPATTLRLALREFIEMQKKKNPSIC